MRTFFKKVAVCGSGSGGLICAGYLIQAGHDVTIFEALHKAGGGNMAMGSVRTALRLGADNAAGMAIDKYLKDGEWWDPNAPKPAETPAAK